MSKENREQTETYLNSMWGFIAQEIGGRRNLSVEKINEFADMGIGYSKTETLYELGLVDGLKYKSEVLEIIKNKLDVKEVEFTTIDELSTVKQKESKRKDVVAVLYAEGQIVDKKAPGSIYPSAMLKEIEMLKKDDDVKAVVLRVNSPGGSAFASEQIWHAIEELKAVKPVVVSMGTYAASGGYYISCGANFIVAEATTLTGSIGVFGIIPDFQGLATDKLGVTLDEVKTNKFGMITILEPVTKEEGVMIQRGVENFYELFLKRCSEGRNIPLDEMAKIAEGRVWSGLNAKEIGLVDAIGGVYGASCKAAELAGLNSFRYEAYPKKKSLMEAILAELDTKATISLKQLMLGENYSTLQLKEYLESRKGIQARMDDIIIK